MEDTREQGLRQLTDAVLSAEGKCNELELSLRSQRDEYLCMKNEQLDALKERGDRLKLKVDSLLARLTQGEEELEELNREQKRETETVDAAIKTEKQKLQDIQLSYKRLQTAVELRSGPETAMPVPPLTFTLTGFDELLQKDGIWWSHPFYSSVYGYKMRLQVCPNGTAHGKGTHVSVFIALLPGEFDDLLMWPYSGEVTVHLLNQKKDTGHICHTIVLTNPDSLLHRQRPSISQTDSETSRNPKPAPWGNPDFAIHSDLQSRGYLKKNTLKFCIWSAYNFTLHHKD